MSITKIAPYIFLSFAILPNLLYIYPKFRQELKTLIWRFFFCQVPIWWIASIFWFQLSNFLAILNAHCVDPEIIKQVFRQVSLVDEVLSLVSCILVFVDVSFADFFQQYFVDIVVVVLFYMIT